MIEQAHILLAIAAMIGGVGAVAAIRIEMRYLRRDVRRAQLTADSAHSRIDVFYEKG